MTVGEAIKKAVRTNNAAMAGGVAAFLRFEGMDYQQTYDLANELTGIGLAEWDALLYSFDTGEV